jgi:hypothetical protein
MMQVKFTVNVNDNTLIGIIINMISTWVQILRRIDGVHAEYYVEDV